MDGIARAVGERVLAACGAARGCFGRVRGAARLHVSAPGRKAAPLMHSASAVLALCAADAHEVIQRRNGAKGPQIERACGVGVQGG